LRLAKTILRGLGLSNDLGPSPALLQRVSHEKSLPLDHWTE
jgi:hypothetical protein